MARAARLRRTKDIALARAEGRSRSERAFALRARPTDEGVTRVAVSGSRDLGPAARRNRARRRLREAVRLELMTRPPLSLDLVLSARRPALEQSLPELRSAFARALDQVVAR